MEQAVLGMEDPLILLVHLLEGVDEHRCPVLDPTLDMGMDHLVPHLDLRLAGEVGHQDLHLVLPQEMVAVVDRLDLPMAAIQDSQDQDHQVHLVEVVEGRHPHTPVHPIVGGMVRASHSP